MNIQVLFLLAVISIPLYSVLGTLMFGGRQPFQAAVTLNRLADLGPWLRGGDTRSFASDLLLGLYLGCCGALILVEYRLLAQYFQL